MFCLMFASVTGAVATLVLFGTPVFHMNFARKFIRLSLVSFLRHRRSQIICIADQYYSGRICFFFFWGNSGRICELWCFAFVMNGISRADEGRWSVRFGAVARSGCLICSMPRRPPWLHFLSCFARESRAWACFRGGNHPPASVLANWNTDLVPPWQLGMSNGYNCRRGSKRVFGFSPSFASLNIWLALLSLLPAQRWIWFPSLLSSSARPPSLFISGRQGRGFVQSMCTLFSCVPMEIVEAATTSRRWSKSLNFLPVPMAFAPTPAAGLWGCDHMDLGS